MDGIASQVAWSKKTNHIFTTKIIEKILFLYSGDALLRQYVDHVNNELLSSTTNEIETLYENVFFHVYKAIQPLDYFSNELICYTEILTHLSKWPILVRVCR